jgi:hypothetical protein
MRFRLFVLVLLVASVLAGCDRPSPWMLGATRHETVLDGYRFTIWQKRDEVEIIRHGFAPRADQRWLRALMLEAARETTGCAIQGDSVEGDAGVLRARLLCDRAAQFVPDQGRIAMRA